MNVSVVGGITARPLQVLQPGNHITRLAPNQYNPRARWAADATLRALEQLVHVTCKSMNQQHVRNNSLKVKIFTAGRLAVSDAYELRSPMASRTAHPPGPGVLLARSTWSYCHSDGRGG